jgi:hypothetical protein
MAMALATNLGAATPVQLIGGPPQRPAAPASSFRDGKPPSLAETPDTEMRKVTNDAAERGQSAFRDFPTSSRVSRAAGISLHPLSAPTRILTRPQRREIAAAGAPGMRAQRHDGCAGEWQRKRERAIK